MPRSAMINGAGPPLVELNKLKKGVGSFEKTGTDQDIENNTCVSTYMTLVCKQNMM